MSISKIELTKRQCYNGDEDSKSSTSTSMQSSDLWCIIADYLDNGDLQSLHDVARAPRLGAKSILNIRESKKVLEDIETLIKLDFRSSQINRSVISVFRDTIHTFDADMKQEKTRSAVTSTLEALNLPEFKQEIIAFRQEYYEKFSDPKFPYSHMQKFYEKKTTEFVLKAFNHFLPLTGDYDRALRCAISSSAIEGNPDILQDLLKKGAIPKDELKHAWYFANIVGKDQNAHLLLDYILCNYVLTVDEKIDFFTKAMRYSQVRVIKDVLKQFDIPDDKKNDAFINALENNELAVLQVLLQHGNIQRRTIENAFITAADKGFLNIVQFFCKNGLISQYCRGMAVQYAAKNGRLDTVQAILKFGAISEYDNGWSVVGAIAHGYRDIVQALLQSGPISSDAQNTCFLEAVAHNHLEILQVLLEKFPISDFYKKIAIKTARNRGHTKIEEFLNGIS